MSKNMGSNGQRIIAKETHAANIAGKTVMSFDSHFIRRILLHRNQMLLLDKIASYSIDEKRLIGIKNVSQNDSVVQGYFPDHPIYPGVLIIEALAQASAALMNLEYLLAKNIEVDRLVNQNDLSSLPTSPMSVFAESKIKQMGFVYAGEQIKLETRVVMQREEMFYFQVRAQVDDAEVSKGNIMLAFVPNF